MKNNKIIAKALTLGVILTSIPYNSFASNINNNYYNEISQIESKQNFVKTNIRSEDIDTWITNHTPMPTKRDSFTCSALDEKVYCVGGYNGADRFKNLEVYNTKTDTWETKSPMPTAKDSLASVFIEGKLYCIGGTTNSVDVYDPKTDTWETKSPMPTSRKGFVCNEVGGKIYCIGGFNGQYLNSVDVYNTKTDTWETKSPMPTARYKLASAVVNGKIYCIGGTDSAGKSLNAVEVYDPKTDSWEVKSPMPTARGGLTGASVSGKIYCIGGKNSSIFKLDVVEAYDPKTDTWETKSPMYTDRASLSSAVVNGRIYCIGGYNGSRINTVESYIASKMSPEQEAESSISNAEITLDPDDIEIARDLVNKLPESEKKDELQSRLNTIFPNISLDTKIVTSNLDLYIKSENMLSMSLDTNSITFDDFSGVEDVEKVNAVNISINSSLPYQLNAYLPVEIQNADKTKNMNKDILNIKENSEVAYQTFENINEKMILKDNCPAGNDLIHGVDIKLKGGLAFEKDIYKTTIKFEAEQK